MIRILRYYILLYLVYKVHIDVYIVAYRNHLSLSAQNNQTNHSTLASKLSPMLLSYYVVKDHMHENLHVTKMSSKQPYKPIKGKTSHSCHAYFVRM